MTDLLKTSTTLILLIFWNIFEGISMQETCCSNEIVIQRRMDGSEDFYRPWADYKQGFGNSTGEFFLGLDKINRLTNTRPYELVVVVEDWENDRRYARYDRFFIGNEAENYVLKQVGNYSGSAGDALTYSLGQGFTTWDSDHDAWSGNCAIRYTGAWWYKNCHLSHLNGVYKVGGTANFGESVIWQPFRNYSYGMKFCEMILRPSICSN